MRKHLIFSFVFFLALPAIAQENRGNLYGKVIEENGDPLPGVTVTLTGSMTAPVSMVSGTKGDFRFISLHPAGDYKLTAKLPGFKTIIDDRIIITVGKNLVRTLVMPVGGIEQEVTVVAKLPVLDLKRTGVSQSVDRELMQSIPTGRDTRSLMIFAPAVLPTQPYFGEARMGYQNNSRARGSMQDAYWGQASIDGQRIEPRYYDIDAWEEFNVSIGGTNLKSRNGDLTYNLITKRGGNDFSFGGRFLIMDEKLQSDNLTDKLKKEGVPGTDKVLFQRDFGFNLGGPIFKDKAWFWMAYGVDDSKYLLITNTAAQFVNTTYNAKLNFQFSPQNRLEIWGMMNNVNWVGRDITTEDPVGFTQHHTFHFGDPFVHISDEHMFGDNLLVRINGFYEDGGLFFMPTNNIVGDLMGEYDVGKSLFIRRGDYDSGDSRPRYNFDASFSYFRDNLFGFAHEIQGGFEWESLGDVGSYTGQNARRYFNFTTKTIDINGDGFADVVPNISRLNLIRWNKYDLGRKIISGYLGDTMSTGHFNIFLGFRYDSTSLFINESKILTSVLPQTTAWQKSITPRTADPINRILPIFTIPTITPDYGYGFFSPRIGIVWDIGGNGKTTAKLHVGRYPYVGDLVSFTKATDYLPLGTSAWLNFWWLDNNGDGVIDYPEFYWHNAKNFAPYRVFDDAGNFIGNWKDAQDIMWGGFDYQNPTQLRSPTTFIPKEAQKAQKEAQEVGFAFERELFADFMLGLNLTYKSYGKDVWTLPYWPDTGKIESKNDYVQVGTVPAMIGGISTGAGAGRPYYLYNANYVPTSYRIEQPRPDFKWNYWGVDIVFRKRMSNKWMVNGSLTLQGSQQHFGANGYLNATPNWALEGQPVDLREPRWMFKVQGLYNLPYGFNLGVNLFARQGNVLRESVTIVDYNAPNPRSQSVTAYIGEYGKLRLDPFVYFALGLEKMIKITDRGKIYIMLDIFNVPNYSTVVNRYDRDIGTYYPHDGTFVPNPRSQTPREITNPRKIKLGIRFQF